MTINVVFNLDMDCRLSLSSICLPEAHRLEAQYEIGFTRLTNSTMSTFAVYVLNCF